MADLSFSTRVRSVDLTGLVITNSAVVAGDSILVSIGKLQGQINAIAAIVPTTPFT